MLVDSGRFVCMPTPVLRFWFGWALIGGLDWWFEESNPWFLQRVHGKLHHQSKPPIGVKLISVIVVEGRCELRLCALGCRHQAA